MEKPGKPECWHMHLCYRNPLCAVALSPGCVQLIFIPDSKKCKWLKVVAWNELVAMSEHFQLSSPSKPSTARGKKKKCLIYFLQEGKVSLNSPVLLDPWKAELRTFDASLWHKHSFPFNLCWFTHRWKGEKSQSCWRFFKDLITKKISLDTRKMFI